MMVVLEFPFTSTRYSSPHCVHGFNNKSKNFLKMTKHTVCPAVLAYRVYKVAEQHKVPVVMYDYYDNCKSLLYRNQRINQIKSNN